MKSYIAAKDGNGFYLNADSEMDYCLKKGFSIYEVDDDYNEKLIATPEGGFIFDRPSFGPVEGKSAFFVEE